MIGGRSFGVTVPTSCGRLLTRPSPPKIQIPLTHPALTLLLGVRAILFTHLRNLQCLSRPSMSNLGTISAQQAGTFPALTQGSYVSQGCGAGPGILDFQVEWNCSGSFSLQVGDSISGNAWETYPVSSIIGTSNGVLVTGAPTASGIYRCAVDGGGASGQSPLTKLGAIIFATALSGGAVVTISSS